MTKNSRPSWASTWFDILEVLSKRSTCPRLGTAALIVSPNLRLLSTGYNGAVSGSPHCTSVGCLMEDNHCVRAVHAELNAVLNAARHGVAIEGCSLYVLHAPCVRCAICIAQAGLWEVHYKIGYGDGSGLQRLEELNVGVFYHG